MNFPKIGMGFKDVKKRVKRISNLDAKDKQLQGNLISSLKNQLRLHEGERAIRSLEKEVVYNRHSTNRTGWSPEYAKRWEEIFKGSG